MNPPVSVIVSAFNAEPYLAEAVASVLAQTHRHLEVIVVDDGSRRPQAEALTGLRDERIRVLRQANGGAASARNAGVRASRGEFLAFLDADDAWLPAKIEKQLQVLANRTAAVAFSDTYYLRGQEFAPRTRFTGLQVPEGDILLALLGHNFVPMSTAMVTRAAFDAVGGFCEDRAVVEDWDFFLRLARRHRFAYAAEPLATYRVHENSIGSDRDREVARALTTLDRLVEAAPEIARDHGRLIRFSRANLLFGLGYDHLRVGHRAAARTALWSAIRLRPVHLPTVKSLVRSYLPAMLPRAAEHPIFDAPGKVGLG